MTTSPVQTDQEKLTALLLTRKWTERELNALGVSVLPPELQAGESLSDMNFLSLTMQELARILELPPDQTVFSLTKHARAIMARLKS